MDSNARSTEDGGVPRVPGRGVDAEADRLDADGPSRWPVVDDPSEWFARPLVDGAGLGGRAGAVLAAKIEEIAARVLSTDPKVHARLSRHDTVSPPRASGDADGTDDVAVRTAAATTVDGAAPIATQNRRPVQIRAPCRWPH